MLIELLSMSNYAHFNVKLAEILGLHPAIYLALIMDINEKAIRKSKTNKNFFTIDRKYVTKRTTLSEQEQRDIETNLIKVGILERSATEANTIQLNLTTLTSILMTPDESLLKDISKKVKAIPKVSVQDAKMTRIANEMKSNIITPNPELRTAYCNWIDAVLQKDGFMNKTAVMAAQAAASRFANRNLQVELQLLEIATINAYRDMNWAINAYNKDYKVNYSIQNPVTPTVTPSVVTKPRLSDEVF